MTETTAVAMRLAALPGNDVIIARAGEHGIEATKVRAGAVRSHRALGILGISVQ